MGEKTFVPAHTQKYSIVTWKAGVNAWLVNIDGFHASTSSTWSGASPDCAAAANIYHNYKKPSANVKLSLLLHTDAIHSTSLTAHTHRHKKTRSVWI